MQPTALAGLLLKKGVPMQIRCPVCDHTREVNPAKIPPTAEFATCPKCRHRFRFRALDLEEMERPAPPEPNPDHADVWDAVDSLQDRWKERDGDEAGHSRTHQDDASQDEPRYMADGVEQMRQAPPDPQNVAIPWENPRYLGYWPSFLRTTLWALFQPSSFFATLTKRPALLPALLYYMILGIVQTICNMLWFQLLGPMMSERLIETMGEEAYAKLMEGGADMSVLSISLLSVPFQLALQLFLYAAIIHVIIRLTSPKDSDFALSFKVAAYASAALALVVIPVAGMFLAPIGYLTLLFIGCRNAFGLTWSKTFMAVAPLSIMMFFAASLSASQFISM